MRLAARQSWPEVWYLAATAARAAAPTSASAKTRNGAWPPSSSDTRFSVRAHWAAISRPMRVEPVKETARTSGWRQISRTSTSASPVSTEKTPRGTPASSASLPSARAEKGVSIEGTATTVQPAARAAAALRVSMAEGKFHGVTRPTTPTGSRCTNILRSGRWLGITSP
jgi:hypothetical protein